MRETVPSLSYLRQSAGVEFPSTGNLQRLTTDGYNEHATFSLDGQRVVWMSNAGNAHHWVSALFSSSFDRIDYDGMDVLLAGSEAMEDWVLKATI